MSYIEENLAQGERVLYIARFPWVYTANAIAFFFFCVALALVALIAIPVKSDSGFGFVVINSWRDITHIQWYLSAGLFAFGFLRFAYMMLVEQTTEIAVTSLRFIYKRGILSRDINSVNIDRVEGCDVKQGFLGFLMGYGMVEVRGTGIGEVRIPPVSRPKDLANSVQQAIGMHEHAGEKA
ncbi:MAG TPA: hypothetical protein DCW68_02115 [Rhodospirillaceae bacterium]|nr:MAG: hypothetical protein A2018_05080 [Alphaproteobacteria bacterium GWF2_58_20]HAU28890.1 hypothetical protein [Rhodospirillaceae bacterium]